MKPITEYQDYRVYMLDYFDWRKRTSVFSWREFSKQAGFSSPSYLKLVCDGKSSLSRVGVLQVAAAMELSQFECEYFKHMVDFTNVDDKGDYRPGMKALAELKIISPLMEAGFHKNDVRDLAKELGLPVWNKPENACLATRIPYGEEITVPKLQMIEQGEEKIKEFVTGHVRVRMRGKDAKIEVDAKEISRIMKNDVMSEVFDHLTGLGFEGVELDIMGYRRGG